ncbi:alpha/beta fold hydrolase [Streptomyces phaeochromogenes]|uniref:alpha/beta fold hydrolase n=1 Tax=Streptomyces phaeochromogenes TaxID=1923 RepID=UPI0033D12E42
MTLSSRTIQVKKRRTEVLAAGQQEPLVLLHGGGIVEGFDCFAPLTERFAVTAPLMPGYGATELDPPVTGRDQVTENLRDVLDELGIERTVLVGHSLGGWRAAAFAARFPERVSELILAAPFGMDVPEHPLPDMMSMGPAERLAALTNDPSIWEGRLPTGPDPAFEAARAGEGQSIMRFHPGPHDPDLPGILSSISAPTLILWGEDDRTIPAGHADAWHKALPQASVKTFPGAGHLLFHERPDALAAIVEFVESKRA